MSKGLRIQSFAPAHVLFCLAAPTVVIRITEKRHIENGQLAFNFGATTSRQSQRFQYLQFVSLLVKALGKGFVALRPAAKQIGTLARSRHKSEK